MGLVFALIASAASSQPAPLEITQKPILFNKLRQQLTLEYIQRHYDPHATSITFQPVMIVVHWTASNSLQAAWNEFNPERLTGRADIASAGQLNTSAPFLIYRNGAAYQLMPETLMARHVIGLNRRAIGIENVGNNDLTRAQLETDARLIEMLAQRYPIQYLIGHLEYGRFRGSALWEEREADYFTVKPDPGADFMWRLRLRLAKDGWHFKDRP